MFVVGSGIGVSSLWAAPWRRWGGEALLDRSQYYPGNLYCKFKFGSFDKYGTGNYGSDSVRGRGVVGHEPILSRYRYVYCKFIIGSLDKYTYRQRMYQ
jgi:hypothetical protein